MIASSLLLCALAGAAQLDVHLWGATGNADPDRAQRGLGVGVAPSLDLAPRLRVEGLVQGGFVPGGTPRLAARPELRFQVGTPDTALAPLSLVGGYGLALSQGLAPEGALGLGWDVPGQRGLALRVQGRVLLDGLDPARLQLAVGGVWGRPPEPAPVPVQIPAEHVYDTVKNVLDIVTPNAQVWVPHPWCAWVPAEEANAVLAQLAPGATVAVVADGYLPEQVVVSGPTQVALRPAPQQGSLLVSAQPGDRVRVDGREVAVGADGLAILTAPEGFVTVQISGGGRSLSREAAIASGHALWIVAPPASPAELRFSLGSSALDDAAQARLAEIAANAGAWRFEVAGSYSPEGDPTANQALALARADAVARALVTAGVAADRVAVTPTPAAAPADAAPEALRAAWVYAIPAEVRP